MFIIKESPGKGIGMFATREIQRGELIIFEKPLLTIPSSYAGYESIIEKLLPDERRLFYDLHDCHSAGS